MAVRLYGGDNIPINTSLAVRIGLSTVNRQ